MSEKKNEQWNVYEVDEPGENYMARSADEAWMAYIGDIGEQVAAERELSRDDVRQLTEVELDDQRFADDCEDADVRGKTFREALAIEVARGPRPQQFSTTYF